MNPTTTRVLHSLKEEGIDSVDALCALSDRDLKKVPGIGERSLDVVSGEEEVVNGTKEIYPGLYVCGMAASAVSGTPRMGPIFGGMLMSGKKVADLITRECRD